MSVAFNIFKRQPKLRYGFSEKGDGRREKSEIIHAMIAYVGLSDL